MSTLSVDTIQGKTTASKVIMPTGHVLQVVKSSRNATSHESFSNTSFATSTLSLSLTPKASGNKVFVQCHIGMGEKTTSNAAQTALYIDGSNVSASNSGSDYYWSGYWNTTYNYHGASGFYEYTTVDTNAHTFALYVRVTGGAFNIHHSSSSVLIATEVQV